MAFKAKEDGFEHDKIEETVKKTSMIVLLIPDQAQKEMYENYIQPNPNPNDLLVFAHGYSLRFGEVELPRHINAIFLAPRMPGENMAFVNGETIIVDGGKILNG